MPFQIQALLMAPFAPFFALSDADLAQRGVRRVIADGSGHPCRVSLRDAAPGETLIFVNHEHLSGPTPYAPRHAVFVRANAVQAHPEPGEVPAFLRSRTLSLRAFDGAGMMRGASLCPGNEAERAIRTLMADDPTRFVDIHFAAPGCFAARAIAQSSVPVGE